MRIEINSGGLNSLLEGISSFGNNNSTSTMLTSSLLNVVDRTNELQGGVGQLSSALGFIQNRVRIEENRRISMQNVERKTENFIQTAVDVDNRVAAMINSSTEQLFQTNPWLRPAVPPTVLESIRNGISSFFDSAAETAARVWNGIVNFVKENWSVIVIALVVILVIALSIVTFGMFAKLTLKAFIVIAGVGFTVGFGGQIISDVLAGERSSWHSYVAAGVGGIVGALTLLLTGNKQIAVTSNAAVSTLLRMTLQNATGAADHSPTDVFLQTLISAGTGFAFSFVPTPRIQGITAGNGSFAHVYKSQLTSLIRGNIHNISSRTIAKGIVSDLVGILFKSVFDGLRRRDWSTPPSPAPAFEYKW